MNPARSVRLDKEASTRWKDLGKDPRGITKRDSRPDEYKEWGARVCGNAVLFDFWCRYAEILFEVVVLRFYKTKRFPELRNFRVILMRFAVFSCYSVPCLYTFLCGFEVFLSPLRPAWYEQTTMLNARVTRERKIVDEPIPKLATAQCWCTHTFDKWLPI